MATQRLFFAISLPDELQQQLVRWRAEHFAEEAGRPVVAANLHLTLAFLGEVSAETSQHLQTLASRIVQPGFDLDLDDAGHWPRPGWFGSAVSVLPVACCSLPACCVRRRHGTVAPKTHSPFIRISLCCAMHLIRWLYHRAPFTGAFVLHSFRFTLQHSPKAARAIVRWPVGLCSPDQDRYALFSPA